MSQIHYGVENRYMNITEKCIFLAGDNDYVEIPASDVERGKLYGDPVENVVKHILLVTNTDQKQRFDAGMILRVRKNTLAQVDRTRKVRINTEIANFSTRLIDVQSRLRFLNGDITQEGVEQLMSVMFIQPGDKVLELGSNIGRNTLIISAILDDESNLVTLETDASNVAKLLLNKSANNMKFNVENAALTIQPLIQAENSWQTIPSATILPGHFRVNSVSFAELQAKYKIQFDVLVADCEGALYYILQEFPELLHAPMRLIVMENDYHNIEHKLFVDNCLKSQNFHRVWFQAGGWGPCSDRFWEVWQK